MRRHGGPSPLGGMTLGGRTEIINRADYDKPGTSAQLVWGALASHLELDLAMRPEGLGRLGIFADTTLVSLYGQSMAAVNGRVSGWAGYLGLSTLYEHEERTPAQVREQLGVVSPIGPTAHWLQRFGSLTLRATAEAHPVFGAVLSAGYASLDPAEVTRPLSASMVKNGYYWAVGARGAASLRASFQALELGMALRWYGLRDLEALTAGRSWKGPSLSDHRFAPSLWLSLPVTRSGLGLRFELEQDQQYGHLDAHEGRRIDSIAQLLLVWTT